jgi:hypothetical protein
MKIYCLEIRDPKLPKSITGLPFFITFFTILMEEKKGRSFGNKKRQMRN